MSYSFSLSNYQIIYIIYYFILCILCVREKEREYIFYKDWYLETWFYRNFYHHTHTTHKYEYEDIKICFIIKKRHKQLIISSHNFFFNFCCYTYVGWLWIKVRPIKCRSSARYIESWHLIDCFAISVGLNKMRKHVRAIMVTVSQSSIANMLRSLPGKVGNLIRCSRH